MATYHMKFLNETNDWWHFGVYQTFPKSTGLESVVWKEEGLPTNSQVEIHLKMAYGVSITNFDGNNVSSRQTVGVRLGSGYQVITTNDIIGIDSTPISNNEPEDIIALTNNTDPATPVDVGFAWSGSIIASHSAVGGKQASNYQVHPKY